MPNVATVLLTVTVTTLPATSGAYKETNIVLTDSAGAVQKAVVNGTETPAWSAVFNNVAAGDGNVVAQAMDVNGAAIGAAITQTFTEVGSPPATFPAPSAITVTVS